MWYFQCVFINLSVRVCTVRFTVFLCVFLRMCVGVCENACFCRGGWSKGCLRRVNCAHAWVFTCMCVSVCRSAESCYLKRVGSNAYLESRF